MFISRWGWWTIKSKRRSSYAASFGCLALKPNHQRDWAGTETHSSASHRNRNYTETDFTAIFGTETETEIRSTSSSLQSVSLCLQPSSRVPCLAASSSVALKAPTNDSPVHVRMLSCQVVYMVFLVLLFLAWHPGNFFLQTDSQFSYTTWPTQRVIKRATRLTTSN